MSTKALRIAIVGTGYFARFHIDAWLRMADAELIALCDQDPIRLGEAQTLAPDIATFDSAESMLDRVKPDVLDIATPPASHHDLVRAAAARGVHVICQKPLAPKFETAQQIVDCAEQAGITLAVHENFRFMPWYQEIARILQSDRLGTLHGITMRMRPGDGQGEQAYLARQPYFQSMERFLIHETAIHFIDTFRFLCGEISGVFARLRRLNPVIKGEDCGHVLFDFANSAYGLFDGNRLNDHAADNTRLTMGELWLEGSAGVLRLDGYARLWFKEHGSAEKQHAYRWNERGFAGDCVYATQKHIVRHLAHGDDLQNSGRAYLRNIVIEEAIYRSAEQGRWINTTDDA